MDSKEPKRSPYPEWVLNHKKRGTEIKYIHGKYYLYSVTSVYDKILKRPKKKSLQLLGRITEENGFLESKKRILECHSAKTYHEKKIWSLEYGFSKWMFDTLKSTGILSSLQTHFPTLWQFIVCMVYCRVGYQSPLKNVPLYLSCADILELLDYKASDYAQKISDLLFELGTHEHAIQEFLQPAEQIKRTVLMDATDIVLQSQHISLAQKGYNAQLDFQPQFVLLYLYDANSLQPLYYRLLPGNIREVSALQNTIKMSGIQTCVYVADKGFFSAANIVELERCDVQYIIPLKRDNKLIPYDKLKDIEQTDNYFGFNKRFIFFAETTQKQNQKIELFLDGKLKEQEKAGYLSRIHSLPENYTKIKFNQKIQVMGTMAILHNTLLDAKGIYLEYKNRGEVEQFFDHLKNTLEADSSHMQRQESLNGWMFINHISMQIIYKIYAILKNTPLNKKQMLNHQYAIKDVVEHLKSIKKINFDSNEFVISEINKNTKILLKKMKIHIP